ncbi:30S ribosomal protein S18 [Candidatus Daviesbacteria bacterium]|nr:30S ribosomal protein S18 [Candidatus Daviesbacteria bacterium]
MVKKIITQKKEPAPVEVETKVSARGKKCQFCQTKSRPSYTDTAGLKRFLTDRAKIVPKSRSGLCSKHQRFLGREIKHARHLGLLPFVPKV